MRELYVYYRIRDDVATRAREALTTMHFELRAAYSGLVTRVLTRRDETGAATWMETYALTGSESGSAGIDARIEDAIAKQASALGSFIDGPRHVEAFDSDEKR
jgi:hypothetical protein